MEIKKAALALFEQGLEMLSISMPSSVAELLIDYLLMLEKWNKAYNLTAISTLESMVVYHLLDSLAIAPYITGQRLLDVGSGAGLPGIPLSCLFAEKSWVLLDSNGKKVRFLNQVLFEFGMMNVSAVHCRVEQLSPEPCFDVIMARAFSSIEKLISTTRHLLCQQGRLLLMKGTYPEEELKVINHPYQVVELSIPGLEAKRHLVVIDVEGEAHD